MAAFRDMWTRAAGLWGMIAGSPVAAPPWRRGGLVPGRRDPKTKSVSSSRHEGLDLAKVAAMCMVVTLHVFSHGGVIGGSEALTGAHWYACNFIKYLCFGAVNCFVLISSYFLSKAHLRAKRAVSFVLQVLFYSVALYLVAVAIGEIEPTDGEQLTKAVFPLSTSQYWFASSYIGLYLLSPLLNSGIRGLSRRQHLASTVILLVMTAVLPGIFPFADTWKVERGYSLIWFIALYVLAAYIGKYHDWVFEGGARDPSGTGRKKKVRYGIGAGALWVALSAISVLICRFFPKWMPGVYGAGRISSLLAYNSVMALMLSLSIVAFFGAIRWKHSGTRKAVGLLATLSFGVYLLSDFPKLRVFLWQGLLNPAQYVNQITLYPYMVCCVAVIFVAGIAVEYLRKRVFDRLLNSSWMDRLCARLDKGIG